MKPILEIKNVSKKFKIDHEGEKYLSLRDSIKGIFKGRKTHQEDFWALKGINLEVFPGECIGIIGRNGAGKSTLLKILSKITPPSSGSIICRGRIASLLEVGTGFHPELTGRENIYLNGSILGLKKKEIDNQFDAIIDFSGVEKFLDTPLKRYSSGMQLRLAFAVAAHLEPEILIIDEVLAVGDAEFQKKCLGKMNEVSKGGRTLLFVSHDLNAVANLCTRVAVIKDGSISFSGDVGAGILSYQENGIKVSVYDGSTQSHKPIFFKKIEICNEKKEACYNFFYDQAIYIDFDIQINRPEIKCNLFVMILDSRKRRLFALESDKIKSKMKLKIMPEFLVRGQYSIYTFINQPNIANIDEVHDACHFEVIDNGSIMLKHGDYDYGGVFGKGEWL